MVIYWFSAGALTGVAIVALLSPWVRLPTTPRRAAAVAAILAALSFALYRLHGPSPAPTGSFGEAARLMDKAVPAEAPMAASSAASPMDSAVAKLAARLAKGGGSTEDWELLAKSYEFLGRSSDAARARAHQLPGASSLSVSGEVTLDPGLGSKATRGETLFIVAKSVDSPGMPVAVFRGAVGDWPVRFTLDDSSSMMAGRTLSGAGRVTVDARISRSGQPLPAAGDLQGTSGVIDPAARKPLSIRIDRVVP